MLPFYQRFYFWGVQGIFSEILFTGVRELVRSGNWDLAGQSSVRSFLLFGLIGLVAELLQRILSLCFPLPVRCLGYSVLLTCTFASNQDMMDIMTFAFMFFLQGLWFEAILHIMETVQPIPEWNNRVKVVETPNSISIQTKNSVHTMDEDGNQVTYSHKYV